ncbi:MAG: YqgE/AlgH family protein [Cytophagales bacterium]|nr:MAG: YqgE/AlgH family protein [Cytophagales bacterium]
MTIINKGDILLSEPFLQDPNFFRSVILVTEQSEQGTLGFVLNQKSNLLLEDFGEEFQNVDFPVYIGGPVEQSTLHFIHKIGNKIEDSIHVSKDWYWGGNLDLVLNLIRIGIIKESEIRFFIGYTGWSKGQLLSEFRNKSWFKINDPKVEVLTTSPEILWREILKYQETELKQYANYPINPSLN